MQQKTGFKLWIQQIKSLMIKRFILFKGRYTLGLVTLILPILAEALICYILPNQNFLFNSISPPPGNYSFNLENYKPYTMPYSIEDESIANNFSKFFEDFYKTPRRSNLVLEKLENDSISSFVLEKRKSNINNMVRNYHTGLSYHVSNNNTISANAYYSTLAYHSGASVINEITNLLMALYSNDLNKTISTFNTPFTPLNNGIQTESNQILLCFDTLLSHFINIFNGVIIAVFMSFFVAHVGRERINGSKHIQLLSGVHFVIYWIGNFIFDMIICLYTCIGLVVAFKIIDVILNNPMSETYPIAYGANLFYYFILLLFSSFGWLTYAYTVSHFFKTEIVGFIVLLLIMAMAVFLDTILCTLQMALIAKPIGLKYTSILKLVFTVLFPSITIKRGLFILKSKNYEACSILKGNLFEFTY